MKRITILFLVGLLLFLMGCASGPNVAKQPPEGAEVCSAPVWNEGDTWKFLVKSQGQEGPVEEIFGPMKENGLFNFFPYSGLKIFPLWAGKKYHGIVRVTFVPDRTSTRPWDYWYDVIEIKDLNVKAGVIQCYKIELTVKSDMLPRAAKTVFYYSPKTKSIIKTEGFEDFGRLLMLSPLPPDYELVSFNLK